MSIAELQEQIRVIPDNTFGTMPESEGFIFKNYKFFPLELLIGAVWNYKQDDEFMAEQLINSLKRNGQIITCQVRLLDTGYYEVVDGNHRLEAFKKLNQKFIIAYDHGQISLPAAQRIALESNELKFKADNEKLSRLLQEIKLEFQVDDLLATLPFTNDEINDLINDTLSDVAVEPIQVEEDDFDPSVLPMEAPKTVKGDLYEYVSINGEIRTVHRLLCGDSTNEQDVERLMDGSSAHLLYTDPPYNIKYTEFNSERAGGKGKDWGELYCSEWNDDMSDADYQTFLNQFLKLAKAHLIEWGHYYVWHATTYFREVLNAFETNEIPYDKVPIQWVKQVAPLSWVRYKRKSEPCIFGGKGAVNGNGNGSRWFGPNNETNIWEIARDHNNNYIHPTQKPVALAARAINNSSQSGEIVLDMFMGSGTTLIASDMLGRVSRGMEYGEKFCDMITLRFAKYKMDAEADYIIYRNGQDITSEIKAQLELYKDLKLNQISMPEIEVPQLEV